MCLCPPAAALFRFLKTWTVPPTSPIRSSKRNAPDATRARKASLDQHAVDEKPLAACARVSAVLAGYLVSAEEGEEVWRKNKPAAIAAFFTRRSLLRRAAHRMMRVERDLMRKMADLVSVNLVVSNNPSWDRILVLVQYPS